MKKDEIYYNPEGSPVVPARFDVRVQLRHRSRGLITQQEMKKHLESLPDDANNGVFVDFEAVVGDEKEPGTAGGTTH